MMSERTERIGFIGLGVMGRPMAGHLLAKGYPLVVHSRSRGPVEALVSAGAREADVACRCRPSVRRHHHDGAGYSGRRVGADGTGRRSRRHSEGRARDRHEQHFACGGKVAGGACGRSGRHDAGCSGQRRRNWRHQRRAVDHGGRSAGRIRSREADLRVHGSRRSHRAYWRRTRLGPDLQGVQPDRDWRRAGRCERSPRAWRRRPASTARAFGRPCSAGSPRAAFWKSMASAS